MQLLWGETSTPRVAYLDLSEAVLQTADLCRAHVDRVLGVPCEDRMGRGEGVR